MHGYLSSFNCRTHVPFVVNNNERSVQHQGSLERNIHFEWERHPFYWLITLCNAILTGDSPSGD